MNEEGVGSPIYRMNEIHNMLCDSDVAKSAELPPEEISKFQLHDRDVIFNRTNSYEWVGRTGLFKGCRSGEAVFASYLVRFVPNYDIILPEFLTAFLNSKHGIQDVKRRSRHSINQTNVNPEEVKEVLIPILGMKLQECIKALFDRGVHHRNKSEAGLSAAQDELTRALGLGEWTAPEPLFYSASFASVFACGRLDAQYFRPKYESIQDKLRATGRHIDLGKGLSVNSRGRQPNYADYGHPVINSKHVRVNRVELDDENRFAVAEPTSVVIEQGDVLLNGTGVGTIGRAAPYLRKTPALPDNHVTVLRSTALDPIYLSVFLNSLPGQLQIEQLIKGSSGQIELYPDDIAKIIVWDAPKTTQVKVRDQVLSAFAQEHKAQSLLDAAKRAVEIAIEDSEKAALRFIKDAGE